MFDPISPYSQCLWTSEEWTWMSQPGTDRDRQPQTVKSGRFLVLGVMQGVFRLSFLLNSLPIEIRTDRRKIHNRLLHLWCGRVAEIGQKLLRLTESLTGSLAGSNQEPSADRPYLCSGFLLQGFCSVHQVVPRPPTLVQAYSLPPTFFVSSISSAQAF